jgi:hypothetical protein
MPNRDALKTLTPEHVETALNSLDAARPLSLAERRAVADMSPLPGGFHRAPPTSFRRPRTRRTLAELIRGRRRGMASRDTATPDFSQPPLPACRRRRCRG